MRIPHPTVLANGTIFVVYRVGAYHYEANTGYSASSDGGVTWKNGIVDDPAYPEWNNEPTVVEFNGNIYVFFIRVYGPTTNDVWFRVWNKTKWENPQQLTNGFIQDHPCVMGINNQLWVVFQTDVAGVWDIWVAKASMCLAATVDIDPDSLNLKSKGKWITTYIELPEGYDVINIDTQTILMDGTIPIDLNGPTEIGDHDGDGIPDLMLKLSRSAMYELVSPGDVTLTITGQLVSGTEFEGSDVIRVIDSGKDHIDENDPSSIAN